MHKHTHTVDCPQFPLQSDIKEGTKRSRPELFIWLNGCHWGTRFSHLPSSANSHLSLSLIIHLIWRPSAWLIRTFPESHLFLAIGTSEFLLLVKMLAQTPHCFPLLCHCYSSEGCSIFTLVTLLATSVSQPSQFLLATVGLPSQATIQSHRKDLMKRLCMHSVFLKKYKCFWTFLENASVFC